MMKQNISMLMDGELCGDEADTLLKKLNHHSDGQQEWLVYHLIGDALRQPGCIPETIGLSFYERLAAEPTVLAPLARRQAKSGFYAMSAVASIMAIAFLGWVSVQINNEPNNRQLQQQAKLRDNAVRAVVSPINEGMNDYLLAHQEFSPSTDVRGAASYIRTVSVKQITAGH